MNCAVIAYIVATGCEPIEAYRVLAKALSPLGARTDVVERILTSAGWRWLPAVDASRFIAAHPEGRFILAYSGHYGALVDGRLGGALRPRRSPFLGAWRAPDTLPPVSTTANYGDEPVDDERARRLAPFEALRRGQAAPVAAGRSTATATSGPRQGATDDTPGEMSYPSTGNEPGHEVDEHAIGGGWYELPGIGKVQGRDAAIAAWEAPDPQ